MRAYSIHVVPHPQSVRQHFQTMFLKPWSRFLPNFTYSIYTLGHPNFVSVSGCYGNLSCHCLTRGKLKIIAISLQILWQKLCQTHHFCPNLWTWLVAMAIERLNLQVKTIWESKKGIHLELCRNVHNINLQIQKSCFMHRCSCTFLSMAIKKCP